MSHEKLKHAQDAEAAERYHVTLHRRLCRLLTSPDEEHETLHRERPTIILPWVLERRPVALLACFTKKDADYVLPLRAGLNRLGASHLTSDHAIPPSVTIMEERQWLLIHAVDGRTFIADDRSSSGSVLLRRDAKVLAIARSLGDMRFAPERIEIDRGGDALCSLHDGDVLVSSYGAFVFAMREGEGVLASKDE